MVKRIERLSQAEIRSKLRALSSGFATLAFVGSGQGTGKTAALQAFLDAQAGEPTGVTSVGVDGAALNGAVERSRAALTVPRGTLLATASGCLAHGDVTREILADTGIQTPLGEVLIVKAHSAGWIELAGPSIVADLARVCGLLETHGARRVLVDGAQGRLSLASPSTGGGTVFTVKHDQARSAEACADEARRTLERLMLPPADAAALEQIGRARRSPEPPKMMALDADPEKSMQYTSMDISKNLFESIGADSIGIWLRGAVTNEFVDRLLGVCPAGRPSGWDGLALIAEDGTRLFLDDRRRDRLRAAGIELRVEHPLAVAAVAVNPGPGVSGASSPPAVMEALAAAVASPLIDVIGGWYAAGI